MSIVNESGLEIFERDVKGTLALIEGDIKRGNQRYVELEIQNLEQSIAMAKFQKVIPKSFSIKVAGRIVK